MHRLKKGQTRRRREAKLRAQLCPQGEPKAQVLPQQVEVTAVPSSQKTLGTTAQSAQMNTFHAHQVPGGHIHIHTQSLSQTRP